jgi:hypothetical protein
MLPYEILRFRRSVVEVFALLECYLALVISLLPTDYKLK